MCVETRIASLCATVDSGQCLARTHHERQRIAVWVAFLGRWQLPINVLIMKAIENALFSPLRGYDPIPYEVPYAATRRYMRSRFRGWYLAKGERRKFLAKLTRELHSTLELLGQYQFEMSGASELCHFLECQLGLDFDDEQ